MDDNTNHYDPHVETKPHDRTANPRRILIAIMRENGGQDNPETRRAEVRKLFKGFLAENPEVQDVVNDQWLRLNFNETCRMAFPSTKANIEKKLAARREEKKKENERVSAAAEKARARIVLMALTMPTGKKLGDSTREDCFATGGWLVEVAKRLKPNELVKKIFTEQDLAETFAKFSTR